MTSRPPSLSVRLDLPNGTRFGPGKAMLLRQLIEKRSIKAAAHALNMSYPRALKLIDQLNDAFSQAIVQTKHGGTDGGGAIVTDAGLNILAAYEEICSISDRANKPILNKITRLLAD